MKNPPISSAACPCCTSTLVQLEGPKDKETGAPLELYGRLIGPIRWCCSYCGYTLMGQAVPISPRGELLSCVPRTCNEAAELVRAFGR